MDPAMNEDKTKLETTVHLSFRDAAEDWDQLKDSSHSNPYQSFRWLEAWSDTLGKEDGVDPLIAVGRVNGKAVVILPLGRRHSSGSVTLSFLGHESGNQNTGIWDPEYYANVGAEQIFSFVRDICDQVEADILVFQNVPETWHGRAHPLVLPAAPPSPSPIFVRDLPADFDSLFLETHSKSSRKNLLRKQRHLQSVDGYRVVRAETREDIQRGFDAFLEQRATRAQETGIPNAFASDTAQRFLGKILGLDTEANGGSEAVLDLWLLEVDGKVRATYLCASQGGTIHAYSNSVAHDELLPNSPGLVLIKEIIERACSDPGTSTLDLGLGEERYKTAWAEPVALRDSRIAVSFKGSIKKNVETIGVNAKSAIRNSDVLWPLVKRLRKWKAGLRRA